MPVGVGEHLVGAHRERAQGADVALVLHEESLAVAVGPVTEGGRQPALGDRIVVHEGAGEDDGACPLLRRHQPGEGFRVLRE